MGIKLNGYQIRSLNYKRYTEHGYFVYSTVRVLVLGGDEESTNFESGVEGEHFLSLLNDYASKLRPELLTTAKHPP